MQINPDTPEQVTFRCNICDALNVNAIPRFHREIADCSTCGSTPRFRGVIMALGEGLFGERLSLPSFPTDKHIKGIGMSEWDRYATVLADKFTFQNTYFHMAPKLDVMDPDDWKNYTDLNFIICTEVFEHVLQPIHRGLANLRRMLRPNGVLIFSVPFTDRLHTKEHFPGLEAFGLCQIQGRWVVVNRNSNGEYRVFDEDVHFHGGPGTVLEMRLFGEADLLRLLDEAGFQVKTYPGPELEIGYVWLPHEERQNAGHNRSYIIAARPM